MKMATVNEKASVFGALVHARSARSAPTHYPTLIATRAHSIHSLSLLYALHSTFSLKELRSFTGVLVSCSFLFLPALFPVRSRSLLWFLWNASQVSCFIRVALLTPTNAHPNVAPLDPRFVLFIHLSSPIVGIFVALLVNSTFLSDFTFFFLNSVHYLIDYIIISEEEFTRNCWSLLSY